MNRSRYTEEREPDLPGGTPEVSRLYAVIALKFIAPFLIIGAYILLLYVTLSQEIFIPMVGLMGAYFIPPAGKESIIPLGVAIGLPWWLVAFSMALLDIGAALFLAWNFEFALKIPILGSWIGNFISGGRAFFRQRPWLERLSFVGIVLFVMFPLQGTGGIGGSLVGMMLGLKKYEVVAAIAIGALVGCFAIALGADVVKVLFQRDMVSGLSALAFILIAAVLVYIYHRSKKKRLRTFLKR